MENPKQKLPSVKTITLDTPILDENNRVAAENRAFLYASGVLALNLISSPGSGKTTLLVETLHALNGVLRCAVIEGDQQTDRDARRIAAAGVPVVQINTRQACHLDAFQVQRALQELEPAALDVLFIENVGNLVCPAEFDLGEDEKVVLMSITEGEDKPVKYPLAFHLASVFVLTKMDLLPHLRFDLEVCKSFAHQVNPHQLILETSSFQPNGIDAWLEWLKLRAKNLKSG
jgi:hydrogenase nickel incorporation protein HypB